MREIKKKSPIPIYCTAAVWALYCLLFPLYKLPHFFILLAVSVLAYFVASKIFPGKIEYVEAPPEPVSSGKPEIDALLAEGRTALDEMKRLKNTIKDSVICEKIDRIMELTDKIFKDLLDDQNDYPQVKRFSNYYLPTTIKLLNAYDRMYSQGIDGENISATLGRINTILDTTVLAYKKQLDALFANQALDIETDITVLETLLKREGLTGKDF